MYYLTWSEGFRPGLLNRPAGYPSTDGSYIVPATTESDEQTSNLSIPKRKKNTK